MEDFPLVSIALPAFNSEKTVGQALASVLLQSYPYWELIFIDDGSTDGTVEVAKGFNDPRIKIFADGINQGLPQRLNEALDRSSGKYFARMDNDDMCFPDRIRRQVEYLESHPDLDLIGTRVMLFNGQGDATGMFPFHQTHREICCQPWNGFYLAHPSWMGRLDWFKKYRYRNVDKAEDQDLLLRSYPESRFECLPELLLAYRIRDRVSLRINSRARLSLLKVQLEIFTRRAQWLNIFLAVLVYCIKTLQDLFRVIAADIFHLARADRSVMQHVSAWDRLKVMTASLAGQYVCPHCKAAKCEQVTSTQDQVLRPAKLAGIRIARISTVPFFVVAQLKNQIMMLGKSGAEVLVVTSNEPELALLEAIEGVTCFPLEIPRAISPWLDLLALFRLYRFFQRAQVEIAHSTTPKAGLLTALAAFAARVPVRLHTFTGQPWVNMQGTKRLLARTSDKLIGVLNTRCYADSMSQRQFLIDQGIIDAGNIMVIGAGSLAGVDLQRFDRNRFSSSQCETLRSSLGIAANVPVLLFVGRITVDKGVRELLQAFVELKSTASDAHLVFVGRFDSGSGVAGEILPSDITCLPDAHVVGHSEVPEAYLAMADILCLPSYREGFGTVVIEAAAMGVPTIGTDIYGLADAVVDGETGLLVPSYRADELLRALRRLLDDKPLRMKMGEAARCRVHESFDAEKINQHVIDEYCSLLSAGN